MAIFFSADLHLGHANIIRHLKRPFNHIDEMDGCIIKNWNNKIGHKDEVYVLGDFSLGGPRDLLKYRYQLNGNLYLIKGNHDGGAKGEALRAFGWIKDYYELKVKDEETGLKQIIILCHYPFLVWNKSHFGTWSLHGHSHGSLPENNSALRMDVGVDTNNFTPYSYDEIKYKIIRKAFKPVDRHGRS